MDFSVTFVTAFELSQNLRGVSERFVVEVKQSKLSIATDIVMCEKILNLPRRTTAQIENARHAPVTQQPNGLIPQQLRQISKPIPMRLNRRGAEEDVV